MTASSSTLQKRAIFWRVSLKNSRSVRQMMTSGWMPMESISLTECWVGLVFSSPALAR